MVTHSWVLLEGEITIITTVHLYPIWLLRQGAGGQRTPVHPLPPGQSDGYTEERKSAPWIKKQEIVTDSAASRGPEVRKESATFVNLVVSCDSHMMMETMRMLMTNDLIERNISSKNALSVQIWIRRSILMSALSCSLLNEKRIKIGNKYTFVT